MSDATHFTVGPTHYFRWCGPCGSVIEAIDETDCPNCGGKASPPTGRMVVTGVDRETGVITVDTKR